MTEPVYDATVTSVQVAAAAPRLAILPLAAIEQHGPHLPVATDLLIIDTIARRVAAALPEPILLLPVFPYGASLGQAGRAGTLWLTAETMLAVVRDMVESLYRLGYPRVLVLNNHGLPTGTTSVPWGNFAIKTAVHQLNYDYPDHQAIWVQPAAAANTALRAFFETGSDIHAGALETALMRHLRPDLVKEPVKDYVPAASPALLDAVPFAAICRGGVWGRPEQATASLGAQALEAMVNATVAYAVRVFGRLAALKPDDGPTRTKHLEDDWRGGDE